MKDNPRNNDDDDGGGGGGGCDSGHHKEGQSRHGQDQRSAEGHPTSSSSSSSSRPPPQRPGRARHQEAASNLHRQRRPQMHPIATSGFSFSPLMPQLSFESPRTTASGAQRGYQPSSSSAPSTHAAEASRRSPFGVPLQQPARHSAVISQRASGGLRRSEHALHGGDPNDDDDEEDKYDSATSDEGEGVEEFDPSGWSPTPPRKEDYEEQARQRPHQQCVERQQQQQQQKKKKKQQKAETKAKKQSEGPRRRQPTSRAQSTRRRDHARESVPRKEPASSAKKPRTINQESRKYKDDEEFARGLRKEKGWEIVPMSGDGACLFRSVAYHLYGDPEYHADVREQCIHYMRRERDHFKDFVPGDFEAYLRHKAKSTTDGNHLEIQAMSELYNRTIEVYEYNTEPINIFQSSRPRDHPIRLSYHNNNHYNAIIDPRHHTFGVGLGLPGLEKPKRVEDDVVEKIKHESMAAETEEQLLAHAKQASKREFEKQALVWEHRPHPMSMQAAVSTRHQQHAATAATPPSHGRVTPTGAPAAGASSSSAASTSAAVHQSRHASVPSSRYLSTAEARGTENNDEDDDALLQLALAQSLQEQ